MSQMPLLVTALLVFVGIWSYMFSVDISIKRLKDEMREDAIEKDEK